MNEPQKGHIHPIAAAISEINAIFTEMGFSFAEGPEIETEFYNFDALNIPGDHPARDMQDTFWLKTKEGEERKLLRTHTSPVQIRYMESKMKAGIEPPYRIIVPGKVFRNEATDATHEAQFHQLEGLVIGPDITLAHLKGTLETFFKKFLGEDAKVRFRPAFFPFTEPSVEIDAWYGKGNGGKGKWLELMGGGMVHPNVLRNAGVDPEKYQGFAFGGGIERPIMIKYEIDNIRPFFNGDLRFVNQF
jgi:phenylalanyl-tRNA synthetase alpha chain